MGSVISLSELTVETEVVSITWGITFELFAQEIKRKQQNKNVFLNLFAKKADVFWIKTISA